MIMAAPVALRCRGNSSQRRWRTRVDAEPVNSLLNPARQSIHLAADRAQRDGRITRAMVPATALEIIDRDGPTEAALRVAEIMLEQLKVDSADPDWAAQLRAVARGYRGLARDHGT
jgi:hypothetical protein